MTFIDAISCIFANVIDEFETGLPPYSYQLVPLCIKMVGTFVSRSLLSFESKCMFPLFVLLSFNVTDPVVIIYNKSPSLVFVTAIVSTDVEPDSLINELGWSATVVLNAGGVTVAPDAIVIGSNPR